MSEIFVGPASSRSELRQSSMYSLFLVRTLRTSGTVVTFAKGLVTDEPPWCVSNDPFPDKVVQMDKAHITSRSGDDQLCYIMSTH